MPVPAQTLEFVRKRHAEALELALWLRDVVLGAEPELSERVYAGWDGIAFRHPAAGYVCAIYPRAGSVRPLSEHGARLDDFDRLLEGDGTQTRHVTITAPDEALAGKLGRLVQEAVAKRVFHR